MNAKDVCFESIWIVVEGGASNNEDRRVDKEREREERGSQVKDGNLERVLDCALRGDVVAFVNAFIKNR